MSNRTGLHNIQLHLPIQILLYHYFTLKSIPSDKIVLHDSSWFMELERGFMLRLSTFVEVRTWLL